jgi:hypothetical protein
MPSLFAGLPLDIWNRTLQHQVDKFRSRAYPESTKSTYRTHLKTYLAFCVALGFVPVPASQQCISKYVAALSQILTYNSLKQYLNIIRLLHLEAGFPNPLLDNWYLKSILQGVRRTLGDAQKPKLPITPDILLRVVTKLDLSIPKDSLFWASILLGFFTFLRKSNLFPPATGFDPKLHLVRSDFQLSPPNFSVKIKSSKTIQFQDRQLTLVIPSNPGNILCPVTALLRAFSLAPNLPLDPAFSFRVGTRLVTFSYLDFLKKLRSILGALGYPSSEYSGHSLRRGGASWAFSCGLPTEFIKKHGDWKSDAYQKYLHLSIQEQHHLAQQMVLNLPNS